MTIDELKTLRTFITDRWAGSSDRWSDTRLAAIAVEFQHVDLTDAQRAVRRLFDEGSQAAPSPSSVKAAVRAVLSEKAKTERRSGRPPSPFDSCDHPAWSILDTATEKFERERLARDGKEPPAGLRLCVCVGCHDEKWSKMPTHGEWEELRTQGDRGAA